MKQIGEFKMLLTTTDMKSQRLWRLALRSSPLIWWWTLAPATCGWHPGFAKHVRRTKRRSQGMTREIRQRLASTMLWRHCIMDLDLYTGTLGGTKYGSIITQSYQVFHLWMLVTKPTWIKTAWLVSVRCNEQKMLNMICLWTLWRKRRSLMRRCFQLP